MLTNPSAEQMQGAMKSVLEIFKRWSVVFGNKYKLENVDRDTLEIWSIALIDLKATNDEVALALRLSLTQKWPPSTPADFIELARDNGEYPEASKAFKVACSNSAAVGLGVSLNWLHDVVRESARRYGMFDLARAEIGDLKRFKAIYTEVIAEHRAGSDFRVPESHRIEMTEKPADPETAKQYIAKIKASLRGGNNG